MLHWALTAAALLLFAYAVRIVFLSSKGDGDEQKQKLGCGFAVAATVLWIYVLNHHLGRPWGAIRIGLGLLLVLPAVQALAKPAGARILRAAAGLMLAVFLAGPVLQDLWTEHAPDGRPDEVRALADQIDGLEELRVELVERRDALAELRADVKAEIRSTGKDWATLREHPELLERVALLGRIDSETGKVEASLARIDASLPELRASLDAWETTGTEELGAASELDALLREMEQAPALDELSTVQQYAREKELQELFEREF